MTTTSSKKKRALLFCFPAKVNNGADIMFNIHSGCLVLHGKIRIDFFRDSNGFVRRIHRKLDRICQIKVAFVVGRNSKFSDGSIDLFHSNLILSCHIPNFYCEEVRIPEYLLLHC